MPVCQILSIPLRSNPSHRSEMVNQVLFGETFSILDEHKNWQLIKLKHDQYEGWTDKSHPFGINFKARPDKSFIQTGADGFISYDMGINWLTLSPGMLLPNYNDGLLNWGNFILLHKGSAEPLKKKISPKAPDFIDLINPWLHVPYLWGGRTMAGIDCSGFAQIIYRLIGTDLPRDTGQQIKLGKPVYFTQESLPGDLAFFSDSLNDKKISHVGIFLNNEKVVHASGVVKISNIDQIGLFDNQQTGYTHYLKTIQRVII